MRFLATILSVLVIALATMSAYVGGATARDGMTGTSVVAEMKMDMGVADTADCPPEVCVKMKECAPACPPASAPVAPTTSVVSFAPMSELIRLALPITAVPDSGPPHGIQRPPQLI